MKTNVVRVYIGRIPDNLIITDLKCRQRVEQIKNAKSQKVKEQKFWAWKVLLYALKDTFDLDEDDLSFSIDENGKWACDKCCFSISHSNKTVAVSVGKSPLGLDLEDELAFINTHDEKSVKRLALKSKISVNDDVPPHKAFLKGWVLKESAYKLNPKGQFIPSNIEILAQSDFKIIKMGENILYLALSGANIGDICFLDENLQKIYK